MPKFAVYYIPPADSDLYRRGSELLGYDVYAGQILCPDNATRQRLPEFDPEWVAQPQPYGFHVTVGYSLYFNWDTLPEIEREIDLVMGCFRKDMRLTLTPAAERIAFWNKNIVVLRCEPDPAMLMLHTMLTARVNPLGTESNISRTYKDGSYTGADRTTAHRVRYFHTPYMLDAWKPHFTLMMPYTGTQREQMRLSLLQLFGEQPILVENITLLVRDDHQTHYQFHRQYGII
jgi:hypothetical protein